MLLPVLNDVRVRDNARSTSVKGVEVVLGIGEGSIERRLGRRDTSIAESDVLLLAPLIPLTLLIPVDERVDALEVGRGELESTELEEGEIGARVPEGARDDVREVGREREVLARVRDGEREIKSTELVAGRREPRALRVVGGGGEEAVSEMDVRVERAADSSVMPRREI